MEVFFQTTAAYKNFTLDHGLPLLLFSIIFIGITLYFYRHEDDKKFKVAFLISLLPFISVLSRMILTWYEGIFIIQEELPLHLCRIIALLMPFLIWFRNKKWINTLYFLIIVGTLQAIITADLQYTFPHYSYILYWIFHSSLVWLPIFIIINLNFKPSKADLFRAFLVGNIYMIATLIINFSIGSNYFYTRQKPPGGSLLDFLGPWPFYIIVVEVLAIILFILAYLPFHKRNTEGSIYKPS